MVLLLQYTIIFASVLCLVALGGCFSEHSGVINLGLEGIMVIGALGGSLTMSAIAQSFPDASALVIVLAVIIISMFFADILHLMVILQSIIKHIPYGHSIVNIALVFNTDNEISSIIRSHG